MPRVTRTKIAVYPSVVLGAAAAGLLATGTAATAHGYVSAPPSRQALCAQRVVPDGGNQQPAAVVDHKIDLGAFPGRHTLLAVWNIGDTPNTFYSCVDLFVGVAVVRPRRLLPNRPVPRRLHRSRRQPVRRRPLRPEVGRPGPSRPDPASGPRAPRTASATW